MGSINIIWDPLYWKIIDEGLNRDDLNDIIYKVIIGEGEDESYYEIYEYISKINYDKILSKEYRIEKFPYSINKILLFDENGCLIPLVKTKVINKEELSVYQKDIIKKKNKKEVKLCLLMK